MYRGNAWKKSRHKLSRYEKERNRYLHRAQEMDREPGILGQLLYGDPHGQMTGPYDYEFDFMGWIDDVIDRTIWGSTEQEYNADNNPVE